MMTHRQRILAAIRGKMPDMLPYVPRIDLWYNANARAGTLPKLHGGKTQDAISLSQGWALHKVLPDLLDQRSPDDILHRAIGVIATRQFLHRFRFTSKIDIRVVRKGDDIRIEYHTPAGVVRTATTFPEEMKQAGSTIPFITEHPIKKPEDYEPLKSLFENIELTDNFEDYLAWEGEIGENGFCCAAISLASSPMHHIQKDFLSPTDFYLHYHDHYREMRALAEVIDHYYYEPLLRLALDCPAEGIFWGGNFDDMITYPPYFEKEILPWVQKAADALHGKGKIIFCHCDGENLGLMDLLKKTRMDMAEAICPHPMTKVAVDEYYRRWSDSMTIFGGIPSNMVLAESASDQDFEAYLDYLFKAVAPGNRFILGIADTTPPDAVFERLIRIGERVEKECRLPLEGGAFRPVIDTAAASAEKASALPRAGKDIFKAVRQDVLDGNEIDIQPHIKALIAGGVDAREILNNGLIAAMEIIGPKFKAGELFIPEVLLSSRAMNRGLSILEPHLSQDTERHSGKILLGTVKGDLHDIGKNMVATLLKGVGFEVYDLGVDVPESRFVDALKKYRPDILALSALLTTTMPRMKEIVEALKSEGLRSTVKVMVGGSPVNQKYADQIGADGYADDAGGAVEVANLLLEEI